MLVKQKIIAIDVFLEKIKTRVYVGKLYRDNNRWHFLYDKQYMCRENALVFSNEFPLTQQHFISDRLFASFEDRIPSRENSAYPDYCRQMGIDVSESDPLILLAALGHQGPSSFLLYGVFSEDEQLDAACRLRQMLDLTIREFSLVFDISPNTLKKIEKGRRGSPDIMRRLLIYVAFPEVLKKEIYDHRKYLHTKKYKAVMRAVEEYRALKLSELSS